MEEEEKKTINNLEKEREREILKIHLETWPGLEPGTCPYMHNRLPLSTALQIDRQRERERERVIRPVIVNIDVFLGC